MGEGVRDVVPLPVVETASPGCSVVTPRGELDSFTAPALRQAIADQLQDDSVTHLVVDLSRTTFLDSSALGVLIGAFKRMREREGRLDVVQPPDNLRRIFEITALDSVLHLHESREQAVGSGG